MKKVMSAIIAACIVATFAGCGGAAAAPEETEQRSGKIKVYAEKPQQEDIVRTNSFAGTVTPKDSVLVYPNQSERVVKTYAEVGDYVNAGDLLFEVRTLHTENKVATAKAELDAAIATAAQMKGSSTSSAIDGVNQGMDSLEDALESMEKGLDSLEEAVSMARKALKKAEAELADHPGEAKYEEAVDRAEEAYEKAKDRLNDYEDTYDEQREKLDSQYEISKELSTVAEKDLKQDMEDLANAMVALQEKAYNNALKQLDDAKVYAPISGTIRTKSVSDNNMISETTPAYEIITNGTIAVEFGVSEKNISKFRVGDKVDVLCNGTTYIGTIVEIPLMADSSTGLFNVEVNVDETTEKILPGTVVKVVAPVEKGLGGITVPIRSVYFEGDNNYVYVNRDGVAEKVKVTVGVSTNKSIEILSGLSAEDVVITTWHPNLANGSLIEIVEAPEVQQNDVVTEEGNGLENEAE